MPLANEILPRPFNVTALAVAAVDVLRFWLTVMAPPVTLMGPEMLMADPIDAFWPERLDSFMDKKLRSVTQAAADLASDVEQPDISPLLAALKTALEAEVSDVRATSRLSESAVVLAADDKGPDLQMQRLMRRAGRAMMPARPILEVNPTHPLIAALAGKHEDAEAIAEAAPMLLDLALVQEGEAPRDASAFTKRIAALLAGKFG